ncbi:MAG TPA: NlpC/P60 family protein [Epsilonproteobacteria bacterium]|nr:NlpC/P60 family protein [Campylobacterota bacterium]
MKIIFLVTIALSSSAFCNIFEIKNSDGTTHYKKSLTHKQNAFRNQNEKEYSYQAFYQELQQQKVLALRAEQARKREKRIAKEELLAKQEGKTYTPSQTDKQALIEDAKVFKGGKYVWGGTTPEGFDCSGYVKYLYDKHNIKMPRTAFEQSKVGKTIQKDQLKEGDLVFFLTDKKRNIPVTHVGIYIGNNEFIHAASKEKGIIISPLDRGSYAKTFVGAKRVIDTPKAL